jgi:hypothetical protein
MPTEPSAAPPGAYEPKDFNVQWNFTLYPNGQTPQPDIANVRAAPVVLFIPAADPPPPPPVRYVTPAMLNSCNGKWMWWTCASGDPARITVGGQLEVGTVLSRKLATWVPDPNPPYGPLPQPPLLWSRVDAWVKYRVSTPAAALPLSAIFFTLNDSAGNWIDPWLPLLPPLRPPYDWLPTTVAGAWRVIQVYKDINWEGWHDENLRAVITFLGSTNPANTGSVTAEIEWFAFKLSTP